MAVIKSTISPGLKTISFSYPVATLFDDVSLDSLTMADKMEKGQSLSDSDRVDEYGLTDDEKYQFENFLIEGHTKVFAKLLKMTSGVANSIAINLLPQQIVAPVAKQVRLELSGTIGSGDIHFDPLGDVHIPFLANLTGTAGAWSVTHFDAFRAEGVLLQAGVDTITFTAEVAGVDFPTPAFTPATGDLAGQVTVITPNTERVMSDPHLSVTIKDKEGYNENYLNIMDKEIYLAVKHYILKEWYVKCLLADPAKYYEMKYVENMKAIQKYGLMLRKPMRNWSAPQ